MDIKRHITLLMKWAKKPPSKQKTNNRIFSTLVKFTACMTKKWKEKTNKKIAGLTSVSDKRKGNIADRRRWQAK